AAAGDGRDQAVRGDPPHPAVAGVGDVEAAVGRDRDADRVPQPGLARLAAVAGEAGVAVAGRGRDALRERVGALLAAVAEEDPPAGRVVGVVDVEAPAAEPLAARVPAADAGAADAVLPALPQH